MAASIGRSAYLQFVRSAPSTAAHSSCRTGVRDTTADRATARHSRVIPAKASTDLLIFNSSRIYTADDESETGARPDQTSQQHTTSLTYIYSVKRSSRSTSLNLATRAAARVSLSPPPALCTPARVLRISD